MHKKQNNVVYVNQSIFDWPCYVESWSDGDKSRTARSYETWHYAKGLLDTDPNEFKVADAIANLKRAINVRLKLLEELHQFSGVGILKKIGALERLEAVGLVRPFLIKQLFDLRNDIEHHDASPPPLSRAFELIDIVWYFLRSTDYAASMHSGILLFESPDNIDDEGSNLWLEVNAFSAESKQVTFRGWLASPFISDSSGWEALAHPTPKARKNESREDCERPVEVAPRYSDRRFISGVVLQSESIIQIWKRMFSLA